MEPVINHTKKHLFSTNGYSSFFKAGIFLVGISLLAMSQIGPFLYDKDIDAHTQKFKIEEISGKSLSDTDCKSLKEHYVECRLAKHKYKTLDSSLNLLDTVVRYSWRFGWFLITCSGIIFFATPLLEAQEKNPKPNKRFKVRSLRSLGRAKARPLTKRYAYSESWHPVTNGVVYEKESGTAKRAEGL